MKNPIKAFKNENGQSMLLFALLFVILCTVTALIIDIGRAYIVKQRMQDAADAAALAAAQKLPIRDSAINTAIAFAEQNGVSPSGITATPSADATTIEVECKSTIYYTFAKIIGFDQKTVSSAATALKGGTSTAGLRPWAFDDSASHKYGDSFVLKLGGGGGTGGFYEIVSYGDQGNDASTYQSNITYGYPGAVSLGDTVNAVNGNKNVKKAIEEVIYRSGDTLGDYTKAPAGDSRVVLVPEIDSNFIVIGYAAIYLESVDNQGYLYARFLYDTTWDEITRSEHNSWGLNNPKLIS